MANPHPDKNHNFQLERIALFSDAIFAIAITLLIIEIKVPEFQGNLNERLTDEWLLENLLEATPKFIGFFVSFFVISLYWIAHHRMFRYVIHCSHKLVWNNILFMLPIVVMPFSTSFLSEFYNPAVRLPLIVYSINIAAAGFFSFRLWRIIGNPKNHLSENMDKAFLNYNLARAMAIPGVFVLALVFSLFVPWLAYLMPPMTPLATKLIKGYFRRKHPAMMKLHG
jgi:uncharacterized membrane protein